MEKRFGFKDLILFLLLAALLVTVWFAMVQYDRQYQDVQQIKGDLAEIKSMLAGGVAVASARPSADEPVELDPDSPFYRILKAKQEPGYAPGDWLVNSFSGGVAKLTPLLSGDVAASRVQGHVIETLATRNPETLEWKGLLAESWQIEDRVEEWQQAVEEIVAQGVPRELLIGAVGPAINDERWELYASGRLRQGEQLNEQLQSLHEQIAAGAPTGDAAQDELREAFSDIERPVYDAAVEALAGADPETAEATISRMLDEQFLTEASLARLRETAASVPDALTIRFKLRESPVFSDGEPVTADDVVFTYRFIMDPAIDAPRHRAYLNRIRSVEKLGEREVLFRFGEPYFEAFELAASFEVLPEHFYGTMEPAAFNQSVGLLMGSGPYMLPDPRAWRPGELIYLVRNPQYWGVKPAFRRLVFTEITNDVARLTAFRNGEIDTFGASPEQYVAMTDDADLMARSKNYDYASAVGGYRYIAWNQNYLGEPTPFADVRVRRALTMLLDRERMIQQVMLGFASLATGPFNPLGKQYDAEVEPWPHDLSRAKSLLAEAGYIDRDGDGVLEGPDGKPFRFTLTYPSGNANYEKMVLYLKDAYARAGIILVPDPLEWLVFTERIENKNFEAITLAWSAGIETDIYQMFHSSQAMPGGDNFVSYINPELDRIIEEARTTIAEDERLALWKQAHRILHEDVPYTFLFFPNSLIFLDDRFANIEKIRLGLNPSEEWYTPLPKQKYTQ